ncbi:EGFR adapter protein-like [Uranotaenia lowii]|uniref:EGFR adapter protein-like n=1 Tax=Uranotaenia lowii TaxID=190385 RepID=UPI002479A113|nr:EGFR adapter protein-like [Uranotaenia lowii]XP_055608198.1 EGFR adapter protein-like [Uranotaenia lowii]XP_055608199.1 EGFR adapter protein-like [Uranotaenia lowii]XP_055608200.1 EGFR adapter protein-like [Uranotaenia lowii]XP_055608201.1 EGFR adapter protein-like [Uranotaenia lowii]XP_055608202.1 EGFR adapter protein-like [Uranotaenia lowii]XP_055608203.1 EGFR adapter protein-like [Uranotaenia lowii]XP_055608204.1 EGFR adapter protein-like [Uranotaenia lowii]
MNCTALNSNQIETTPNNHPRLGIPTVSVSVPTGPAGVAAGSNQKTSSSGSAAKSGSALFFHRTNNLRIEAERAAAAAAAVNNVSSGSGIEPMSPAELNNCRRLQEKPPLVKRLTMSILRTAEDSRPLVHSSSPSSSSSSSQTISDGYVNEGICAETAVEANVVYNKFGDSCQRSLTAASSVGKPPTTTVGCPPSSVEGSPRYNHSMVVYQQQGGSISSYPMLRNDCLSLKEQHDLQGAPWFQAGIPREISLEVLSRQTPGAFLVRQSTTKPGCFALSLRVPPPAPKVAHYLILRTIRGYKIKGFTKEFTSLRALITHHSVMPELLPVPLALPRPPQMQGHRQEDPEMYGSLNEFQKIMAE